MGIYEDMQANTLVLLNTMTTGVVTIKRRTGVIQSPDEDFDPDADPVIEEEFSCNACSFGVEKEFIDGKTIFGGETQSICPAEWTGPSGTVFLQPDPNDKVVVNNEAHQPVQIEKIPRDGTTVCWIIISKK